MAFGWIIGVLFLGGAGIYLFMTLSRQPLESTQPLY